jgi:hypothetical protein
MHTLKPLLWVTLPDGGTQKKNCWNITNNHDAKARGFWFKLLLGFLPTLERQRAWYPQVYNRPELYLCAKCKQTTETPEHMFECADRTEIEACFRDRSRSLQPRETEPIDISALRPWDLLGLLQGRVHPSWKSMIPMLQQGMHRTASTAAVIQQLLRASLETWYHAIWLPRCKRTIEQEQSQGLYQGTKIRRMRTESRSGMHATPSPTPNLPRSFPTGPERKEAYNRFISQLMGTTATH